jgi:hypothetical protein
MKSWIFFIDKDIENDKILWLILVILTGLWLALDGKIEEVCSCVIGGSCELLDGLGEGLNVWGDVVWE